MKVSYNRFFKLLIDKQMKKGELCQQAGISPNTMMRMAKGLNLNVDILVRICSVLNCTIDDLMELIPEEADDENIATNRKE
jgi:DNA-binding Xre family transcriptional regulator